MDTLPDLETFDIFRLAELAPDLDRIEAVLQRSEKIAVGLARKFPENEVFAAHLANTRRGLALIPEARKAQDAGNRHKLDTIATDLAALFTTQGKADKLAEWGLLPG